MNRNRVLCYSYIAFVFHKHVQIVLLTFISGAVALEYESESN